MSPTILKFNRTNSTAWMAFTSISLLLIALSAHPQSITGSGIGGASNGSPSGSTTSPSSKTNDTASKTTSMGSAADASGNAGTKLGAKSDSKGNAKEGQMSRADRDFMRNMAYANISEITTGELAKSKTQNDQVKAFAQKMIDDHTKALDEIKQLAQAKGVTLPAEPDAKHKAATKALEKLSGPQFDAMYMKQAGLNDHQNTFKLLERVSKNAQDPELKAYATKTLGPVKEHLKMAQQQQSQK